MSEYVKPEPHPLYEGSGYPDDLPKLHIPDGNGDDFKSPIKFLVRKPEVDGKERDQTFDAAAHMRYAHTLNLPQLNQNYPRLGRAIIVGGAPSIKRELDNIKALAADPLNAVFALNWSHTWLIDRGVVPTGCVFFEIDAEPDDVLKRLHPDCTYYVCSHCHEKTFDALKGYKVVLWHSIPNSEPEHHVREELFKDNNMLGGGISTFTRTMTVALHLGYRHLDIFGCDSSYPEEEGTHVEGYSTVMDDSTDGFYVYAQNSTTNEVKRYKTLGYLALQVEEFKEYCRNNHIFFSCRVHGDSLLRYVHSTTYPNQYDY